MTDTNKKIKPVKGVSSPNSAAFVDITASMPFGSFVAQTQSHLLPYQENTVVGAHSIGILR
ncbi:MAG: hypothetical protein AB1600_00590 [Bacteroidota bacterium]